MSKILKKINSKSITFYIENNLDDFYSKSAEHSNFSSRMDEKISWVHAKKSDWPDSIFRANFENLKIEHEIRDIKNLIKKEKAPNGWTVGPLTRPKNLGIILEDNGFSNVYQQAGMAVSLKKLIENELIEDNLKVEVVKSNQSLNQWIETVSSVFKIRGDPELLHFLLSQPEVRFYLGLVEKRAVSALMLYLSSGVAGLHAVSTLPGHRQKGYGLKISRTALIDAYKMGYSVGVLQASSLGEIVYKKLGFKKFCDIISYAL